MPGLFDQIRFRALKLIYDTFFVIMLRDSSWQEPLFALIAPEANSRVLNCGPGSASIARNLALRFPEASFIGADPNPNAVEKAHRIIARHKIPNLVILDAPSLGPLPFHANSFDKVILVLTLHDRLPDEKLSIAKETLRVLRRGGMLHVADYDKPATPAEGGVLKLARYISGLTAAEPHIDGSWTELFARAGFTGVRRKSSHSIKVGRISLVQARKR